MAFELPFLFASSKGGSMYLGGVARGSPGCFSVFCRPLFAACGRFTLNLSENRANLYIPEYFVGRVVLHWIDSPDPGAADADEPLTVSIS